MRAQPEDVVLRWNRSEFRVRAVKAKLRQAKCVFKGCVSNYNISPESTGVILDLEAPGTKLS